MFSIAGRKGPVDDQHAMWTAGLPALARSMPGSLELPPALNHGSYFKAIHSYFQNEGAAHLHSALSNIAPETPHLSLPERLDVILEKHGEFYHPARIRVPGTGGAQALVLNVATTSVGHEWMGQEIDALKRVANRLPERTVPQVYGQGAIEDQDGNHFEMFLADWFDEYHEFHLSIDPEDLGQKIIVWDNRKSPYYLATKFVGQLYYKVAYLLTRAYDPQSTRQIYPWHHASGDFILRWAHDDIDIKLISVRQYAPTLVPEKGNALDEESRLLAVITFFANLTLRTRIDRFDGTGDMAWADDRSVHPTVDGFKQALVDTGSGDLGAILTSFTVDDWHDLLSAAGNRYRLMPSEQMLFDRYIPRHSNVLYEAIQDAFQS